MYKNWIIITLAILLTLISWIYLTSTSVKYSNGLLFINYTHHTNEYLIRPANATCSPNPYVVILVMSYVGNVELRSAHRLAMPANELRAMNATRVFMLARIPEREKSITQEAIDDEHKLFGDILQGTFYEHYRNLTYKHLMGLNWASETCKNTPYIIKLDDDIVFNLKRTYKMLAKLDKNYRNLLIGRNMYKMKPQRKKQNKWYVTWNEYGATEYPLYLSGWFYVTTPKVASRIVQEAKNHPFFWIDDVFITGIIAEALEIERSDFPPYFWMDYYEYVECCIRDMVKKNIECNYTVGPNGGRNNLIVEFNRAIKMCKLNNCVSDPGIRPGCVQWQNREIFSDGKGEIQLVKFK